MDQIPAIARVFAYLSLLTVGGGMAAFPEMKRLVVDVHHWLTDEQLVHIYSVGQLSPGPNMMMVAEVGERVAFIPGAIVAALAFFVPTGLLTFGVGRIWNRLANWPWRAAIQTGLGPVAIGLAVGGLIIFARGAIFGWVTAGLALLVFIASMRTSINPALLIFFGGLVGAIALR
ncbi:MAG: chromate transporter [Candidatus Eremiobacteraeota bacterium]|nr:chromate transporter [Candidatus Eremiobacteraeota bacterium]